MIKSFFRGIKSTLGFIQNHFKAMLFLLIVFLIFAPSTKPPAPPSNLIQIDLTGMIVSHEDVVEKLQNAANNKHIKGILLNVNSGGGLVPPSIEIAQTIKRIDKPIIAYASGTMASGSYYASVYADKIVANPGSIIGSIGVIFEGMNFEKLLETIGVAPQTVKVGKYKEAGTPKRSWSEYERAELETIANDIYEMFVNDVADARELDASNHESFANAHIYTAARAKEHGLIDEVATMYEAKKMLEVLSGVDEPRWREKDRFEQLLERFELRVINLLSNYSHGLRASF